SSGVTANRVRAQAMKFITFACDMAAPFGNPVDPDVNMMYAGSAPVTSWPGSKGPSGNPSRTRSGSSASTTTTESWEISRGDSFAENTTLGWHLATMWPARTAGFAGSTTT